MKSELIDVSQTKKNLDIEIPPEIVDHEILHIAREFVKRAKVPGFRPGKAPIQVVRTRYRDEIVSEMMQNLLPKYFGEAVDEKKLEVVHSPRFEKIDYGNGKPLRFKAVFEVYPELTVNNYIGVPVEETAVVVEDAEIDNSLKRLQEEGAEMVPVETERGAQDGDFAEISFTGVITELPDAEPIKADKVLCEIGGRTTLKEFNENLSGAGVGDERTFRVTYREDYPEKRLAGKTVEYKVLIDSLKQKELPVLDDDFAQGYGDYQTLDELRTKIREDIEAHKKNHANEQMRQRILEWLEDNNDFEVPEILVDRQLESRLKRMLNDLARQGIDPQRLDVDWSKIREDQKGMATRDVKGSLILEHVAVQQNLDVTYQEIEDEVEVISNETRRPKEKVREVLTQNNGLDRLRGQLRNRKALDFLQQNARIQPAALSALSGESSSTVQEPEGKD